MNKSYEKYNLISVIVPAHNAEDSIEKCILSIVDQSYTNLEIIIVENGSKDNTLEICTELKERYRNIRLISEIFGNVSNARNKGIRIACGDYITFADADDYYESDYFEKVNDELNINDVDILVTGYTIENNATKTLIVENEKEAYWSNEEFIVRNFVDQKIMGVCWNRIYKKQFIKNIQFNPELIFMQDSHFNVNVAKSNRDILIKYIDITGYVHVSNDNSETSRVNNMFVDGEIRFVKSLKTSIDDFELTTKEKQAAKAAIANVNTISHYVVFKTKNKKEYADIIKTANYYFWNNYLSFICCKYIPLKKKIISTIVAIYFLIISVKI